MLPEHFHFFKTGIQEEFFNQSKKSDTNLIKAAYTMSVLIKIITKNCTKWDESPSISTQE